MLAHVPVDELSLFIVGLMMTTLVIGFTMGYWARTNTERPAWEHSDES